MRVRGFENWAKGEFNPTKQFVSDFPLSRSEALMEHPFTEKAANQVGNLGIDLCRLVAAIPGISKVTISKTQIRVYKNFTFEWSELTKPIQEAFEKVCGVGAVQFIEENPISHFVRKTRTELNLYHD